MSVDVAPGSVTMKSGRGANINAPIICVCMLTWDRKCESPDSGCEYNVATTRDEISEIVAEHDETRLAHRMLTLKRLTKLVM